MNSYETLLAEISQLKSNNHIEDKLYVNQLLDQFFNALEQGHIRAAMKNSDGEWLLEPRVKEGILLSFLVSFNEKKTVGPFSFIDKNNLWPRQLNIEDGVRLIPGSSFVRRGAYVAKNVALMSPSFINVAAYIDEGTLIDSNTLVGSCAQVGKRIHISAGVQIGGVLEPVGAMPVIIEDGVLVGGNAGIFEGTIVSNNAVIGAGVILTKSSRIFDLVNEQIIEADEKGSLIVPANAVVVPGARAIKGDFAKSNGLSISTPLIIKYRDEKTNSKTELEKLFR